MKDPEKTSPLQARTLVLEQKKNEFLAAVYEKNFQVAEQIYVDIVTLAECSARRNENFEKRLNQVQTFFKCFSPALNKHCTPMLQSYNTRLKKLISEDIKRSADPIQYIDLPAWEKNLDLDQGQKNLLYKTAMTFQLTSGCSNYCRRCNEWALPGVRYHFTYQTILTILSRMAEQKNDDICLYGASDPLDWEQDGKTILHIVDFLADQPMEYSLLTKAPKGKEPLLKKLLEKQANISVSITSKNKTRIKKIEKEIGQPISKQHDLDKLLIPAGLDEDFMTIKPSITDGYGTEITPDGAFIIIPTFTSALYPFGHKKIPVTSETLFFPAKKIGRNALLVDYFKPLEGYDRINTHCHLTHLLDVQVASIILDNGTDELTPPGMRSIKEYFSIFDEPPRLQRKKMRPSVLKRLKKQFLLNTYFKNLSQKARTVYLKKITSYLNLCKKQGCLLSKQYALSFFLTAIDCYVQENPTSIKIVRFLLKDEIKTLSNIYADRIPSTRLEDLLIDPDIDFFEMFRYCVFCLLNRSKDRAVRDFIKTCPSVYDPVGDIFVQSSSA